MREVIFYTLAFVVILAIVFFFASTIFFGQGMTNEEIIRETKLCEENGLKAGFYTRYGNERLVICEPKEVK